MTEADSEVPERLPASLSITALVSMLLQAPVSKQEYLLLEVETDAGITGVGDVTLAGKTEEVQQALRLLRPLLVGRDPMAGADVWQALAAEIKGSDDASWAALGGIDMALWDIRGKVLGVPVYKLNGGPTRIKARVFAPLAGTATNELIDSARQQYQEGIRVCQFSPPAPLYLDANPQHIRDIRRTLEKLREAVPGGDFIVDCRGKFSPTNATLLARELQPLHPLWLDEPCPKRWETSFRSLAQETVVPLGAGRWDRSLGAFLHYLREQTLDVLRPDIIAGGGFTFGRKVAHLAEAGSHG